MNVENRKLFTNRDARAKLATMGGIMASSPELLGEVQKFSNGQEVKIPDTDTEIKNNIISKYLNAMTESPKPENESSGSYERRLKTYLFNFIVGSEKVTPEIRDYAERLINDAISDIDPETIKRQSNKFFKSGNFFGEAAALNDRVNTLAYLQDRSPGDFTFNNSVIDSLGARSFRDDDQAAAVAQEFVAMPTPNMELSPSNVSPFVQETSPLLSQPNMGPQPFSSESMMSEQAPRPTVSSLEAPSISGMPLVEPSGPAPDRTRTLGDIVAENPRTPERDAVLDKIKQRFANMFSSGNQDASDSGIMAKALEEIAARDPEAMARIKAGTSISSRVKDIVEPVAEQASLMNVAADSGPESGMFYDDVKGGFNIMPPAPYPSELAAETPVVAQSSPMNVAADSGPESGMFYDDVKSGFNIMPPAPYPSELDEFFSETIENQKQAMPGGVNISEYRENLENYLSPESMKMAETIQVGNVPYKYDRNTGIAYRMDGAPITAAEQASVDRILTSDQPVGFGTFSTDSPTPIEMLNAPIEASQQAQDAKVTAQEDLVFNMDPKKTTFAERAAQRKRLMELNELPSVTAEDVGAPEPLVTQKEVDDLSEDRRTGALAQEQNQIEADAITQNDADAMDLEDAGSGGPSNLIDIIKVVTAIDNNESTSDALVGGATGTNQNLTPKESVKAYQAIFKEMLGVDDEDKEKEKYHQMAMIGFAIAAGQDPNALSNVAGGLLEGTKLARKDRKDRKALQAKVDMAAFNAAREDTQRSEDLANRITLAGMTGGYRKGGHPNDFAQRTYSDAFTQYGAAVADALTGKKPPADALPGESQEQYAERKANLAYEFAVSKRGATATAGTTTPTYTIGQRENDAVEGLIEYTKDGWRKVATG